MKTGILTDKQIRKAIMRGDLGFSFMRKNAIQPAGIDLSLSGNIGRVSKGYKEKGISLVDTLKPIEPDWRTVTDSFIIESGEFLLGATVERIYLSPNLAASIEGVSSIGREGLMIHATAGWVDPGWKGALTLEISNISGVDLLLHVGQRIGQLVVFRCSDEAERPYGHPALGSRYADNPVGPQGSRNG